MELVIVILCLLLITFLPTLGLLIAFAILALYLVIGKDRKQKLKSIGFKEPPNWWKTIIVSLLLGIIIEISLQIFFYPIIEKLTGSKIDLSAFDSVRGNFPNYIMMVIAGWVVGGFIEEILYRGFLITRLAKLFKNENSGNSIAIILTSAIFAYTHIYQGWNGVIITGLFGILIGFIFIKNNKILWYTILIHGFVNLAGFTIIYLNLDKKISMLLFP